LPVNQWLWTSTENTTFTCVIRSTIRSNQWLGADWRAISNSYVYVLDQHFDPSQWEFQASFTSRRWSGARLLDQPELTAAKFVNDPFCNGAGQQLYKTGDSGAASIDWRTRVPRSDR